MFTSNQLIIMDLHLSICINIINSNKTIPTELCCMLLMLINISSMQHQAGLQNLTAEGQENQAKDNRKEL